MSVAPGTSKVSENVLTRLCAEFDSPPEAIRAVAELLARGASPQFVTLFRRDESGDMTEERVAEIEERWSYLEGLEARKAAILQQAQERGADLADLQRTLDGCHDQDLLDDLYQSFRPKRRTAGMQAQEKGLGPLALAVEFRTLAGTLQEAALEYVNEELTTAEAVLEGVLHILAEKVAANPLLRARIRDELSRGILKARATAPTRKGAQRYEEFFAFEEPLRRIPANRMLALRRAEREGIVEVQLCLPEGRELEIFAEFFAKDLAPDAPLRAFLDVVFRHAYEQLVRPACEADIRRRSKEKADRETVRGVARSLRAQLMAPPLGSRKVMVLRATRRSVWAVVLDEDGSVAHHATLHIGDAEPDVGAATAEGSAPASEDPPAATPEPPADTEATTAEPTHAAPPADEPPAEADSAPATAAATITRADAVRTLTELIGAHRPAALCIPHGRRQEASVALAQEVLAALAGDAPLLVPIDEAAGAIHATTPAGRKLLPGAEVGIRTAVSLGRRLQDPMLELLSMDLRSLGLGHSLAEVHQGLLQRQLDAAIASCLAHVGVDVNRAPAELLAHVPGIDKELAKRIVERRASAGGFRSLQALREVDGLAGERGDFVLGFLRVHGGDEPLDATAVHPESYELAQRIAQANGSSVAELFGRDPRRIELGPFFAEGLGRLRLLDVARSLGSVGRDPRGELAGFANEGVRAFADLRVDLELRGRVTNLTDFGAFLDLGIGQDGLLHISQIPPGRLRDTRSALRVGEVLTVYVTHLETKGQRISLSMRKPRHLSENRPPTVGERTEQAGRRRRSAAPPREVMSRAARAPEGRRGGPRRGPRPATKEGAGGPRMVGGGGGGGRGPRGPGRGGPSGPPRVITVESSKPIEQNRGHKGEFRSLAGLRGLLGPQPEAEPGRNDDGAAPPA
jgi:uncharacterized protein